jgi:hypothetical protein
MSMRVSRYGTSLVSSFVGKSDVQAKSLHWAAYVDKETGRAVPKKVQNVLTEHTAGSLEPGSQSYLALAMLWEN